MNHALHDVPAGPAPAPRPKRLPIASLRRSLTGSLRGAVERVLFFFLWVLARRRLRNRSTYPVTVRGTSVQFSIDDDYSKVWFYTRGPVHEPQVTEMLLDALDHAPCFADVGAHLGWFACLAGKRMTQGRVYAFEMDGSNFALLQKNVTCSGCTNIEVHNLAVSASPGTLSYTRWVDSPSPVLRLNPLGKLPVTANVVSVGATSLDAFFRDKALKPGVVKIDVEGAEMDVLSGMRDLIAQTKPVLFVEIHPGRLPAFNTSASDVVRFLRDHGYRVGQIESLRRQRKGAGVRPVLPDTVSHRNVMLYAVS